jgi:DNA helicase II / ATP-dependent DNA helicase PcrA
MFNQFTLQQAAIISHEPSTMAVYAAPGSGKTTVLTHHLTCLMEKRLISPRQVWALTFTRKAASELQQRLLRAPNLRAGAVKSLCVGTFHAQMFSLLLAHDPGIPRILDPKQQLRLLASVAAVEGVAPTRQSLRRLQQLVARAAVTDTAVWTRKQRRIIEGYQKQKKGSHVWDFEDILLEVKRQLTHHGVAALVPAGITYVLVDEFQDTNDLQFWILKHVVEETGARLFVVGDDDQAIYGFRGASPRFLTEFHVSFPSAQSFELSTNFRSTEKLLRPAWQLISRNRERHEKCFAAHRHEGHTVQVMFSSSDETEQELVVRDIMLRLAKSAHESIAVLARTRRQLWPIGQSTLRLPRATLTISTFHEAKGREWDTVIILDAVTPNPFLPSEEQHLTSAIVEEERRLFYVAMTRARNELIIHVPERLRGMSVRPSNFLVESGLCKT